MSDEFQTNVNIYLEYNAHKSSIARGAPTSLNRMTSPDVPGVVGGYVIGDSQVEQEDSRITVDTWVELDLEEFGGGVGKITEISGDNAIVKLATSQPKKDGFKKGDRVPVELDAVIRVTDEDLDELENNLESVECVDNTSKFDKSANSRFNDLM